MLFCNKSNILPSSEASSKMQQVEVERALSGRNLVVVDAMNFAMAGAISFTAFDALDKN